MRCPGWLHPYAKNKWPGLQRKLPALRLLSEIDGESLAMACTAWAEHRVATETLAKEGHHFVTKTGYLSPHPAVAQQRSAW
jgi:P27 family predicted phage terminase small subunit